MGNDVMKNFTDLVIKSLDETDGKIFPWVRPWRTMDCTYRNAFSNHKYSGLHNVLTCMLENRKDPRYASFNQIKKSGGKLKSGSKATRLIAWRMVQKTDDVTGKSKTIPFAKDVCVFSVENCEGLTLEPINNNVFDESITTNTVVEDLFKTHNVTVQTGSNRAAYIPALDSIQLPDATQFKSSDEWSGTALHELVHWTAKRVERDCTSYSFDIEERAMEELVAELGSMFLCMILKINGSMDVNNLAYLKSWKSATKGKHGDRFIYKACSLAEKACKYLVPDYFKKEETEDKENAAA
jgi:antirestriction protein ArdC